MPLPKSSRKPYLVKLEPDVMAAVKAAAASLGTSASSILEEAAKMWLYANTPREERGKPTAA